MNPGSIPVITAGPIWLVRHAETEWTGRRWSGRSDPPLNAAGRVAADKVAATLAAEVAGLAVPGAAVVGVILASPLKRALETAERIATAVRFPVRIEWELVEIDFGILDGLTWDELAAAHPGHADWILAGRRPDWPGGETAIAGAARARSAAQRIVDAAAAGPVVVVSHGGLLAEIAGCVSGPSALRASGGLSPASAQRFELVAGGWTRTLQPDLEPGNTP